MTERNHEVPPMKGIYSLSKRSVICFGEEADGSTHTMETLQYYAKQVESFESGMFGDCSGAEHVDWWDYNETLPFDESLWSCIIAFFKPPWFGRGYITDFMVPLPMSVTVTKSKERTVEALLGSYDYCAMGRSMILWKDFRKTNPVLARNRRISVILRSLLTSYEGGILPNTFENVEWLLA
ncbi:hypothetical protein BJ878DRAFT_316046 [Calycina marina]|uniref:Uncharacterized protein n=1 Tax=Calycina marina TaxID=1763456 RepID=A0A9P8CGP7_9HELO|nr:hypothetical protein BJ878DRAFT_316046 [Calycina marina]